MTRACVVRARHNENLSPTLDKNETALCVCVSVCVCNKESKQGTHYEGGHGQNEAYTETIRNLMPFKKKNRVISVKIKAFFVHGCLRPNTNEEKQGEDDEREPGHGEAHSGVM